MEKENKIKFLGIFLIMALMLSFVSVSVSANDLGDVAKSQVGNVVIEQLFSGAGTLLNKVFGLNPIVHGVLAGAFSAFNTFSQLSKLEIDFALDRDQVNLSVDEVDYFEPYDKYLLDNRIDQEVVTDNMLLTDKNILDARFINTKNLSEIDDGKKSPLFRLAEKTKLITILDSNNQPMDIQKREILFEDTNKTIENEYEYRNFVIRYPKSTYTGQVDYDLEFSDLFGSWANLFIPLYNGASYIKISKFLDGSNKKLLEKIDEEKKEEIILEPFKLIFNSYVRDDISGIELDQVNCIAEDGTTLLGSTGTEALPRIAFDWTYSAGSTETISGMNVSRKNWCDADLTGENNKQSIYCDATQFSIELLNKLKDIETFVQNNKGSFTCPTPGVTQSLISENNNLGITQLNSGYESSLVTIDYLIEGSMNIDDFNYMPERFGNLSLTLYKDGVEEDSKVIEFTLDDFIDNKLSGTEEFNVGVIFDEDTKFKTTAILTLSEPYSSVDSKLDNILENEFTPNSEVCNLEKTSSNINLFSKTNKIDTSLVEFRSYLMKDGYSNDFKADFDRYYRYTITAAPDYYKDSYYKYFITDNFTFRSSFDSEPGRLILQGPGRYNVLLKVTFDDEWNLFNKTTGDVSGNVEVILTKELAPERDSPLYYMPFNGLVGIDSENARQGYGVDFTGDVVTLSQLKTNEYLRTEPFTQSNTINTISVKEYGKEATDFSFINNDSSTRGMLLDISLSSTKTNPKLVFVPSRATPVVLKVSNQANNAYSFYKLDIGAPQAQGGSPASTSGNLVNWTGVGNCLDFTGTSVQEAYLYRPDIPALSSRFAPTTSSQGVSYGVEWDAKNITRRGDVYLRTVFYTPSNFKSGNGVSVLYQDAYDDDAVFYTRETDGSKTVELKNILGQDIKFVSEIFALVKDKKACIDYTASNLKIHYNPIAVSEPLFDGDLSSDSQNNWINARGACIVN